MIKAFLLLLLLFCHVYTMHQRRKQHSQEEVISQIRQRIYELNEIDKRIAHLRGDHCYDCCCTYLFSTGISSVVVLAEMRELAGKNCIHPESSDMNMAECGCDFLKVGTALWKLLWEPYHRRTSNFLNDVNELESRVQELKNQIEHLLPPGSYLVMR